jgi:integrase
MRVKLTPAYVRDVEVPCKERKIYWDAATPSFGLMVTCNGARSFIGDYRNADGVKRRKTWPVRTEDTGVGLTIDQAKREFTKLRGDAERGRDCVQEERNQRKKAKEERRKHELAATTTVKAILEDYLHQVCGMSRHNADSVTFDGRMRSGPDQLRTFEQHVYDVIGEIQVEELKRSKITTMLDGIAKKSGPVMADRTLAYLRAALNWHAARTDDFKPPIVRGMARTKSKERARKRILADDEIRDMWNALDVGAENLPSCYPAYLRTLLLTGLRRNEASKGSWPEFTQVHRDGFHGPVWTIPAIRMKNKLDHAVPLTPAVLAVIGSKQDAKARPYVFSTMGGRTPFSGFSKAKKSLEEQIAKIRKTDERAAMEPWGLHDLRRTAKTLMTRAGVRPDISERVLSHTIPGVEGIYDRWEYLPEKLDALEKLAALVDRIVHAANNVVPLRQEA